MNPTPACASTSASASATAATWPALQSSRGVERIVRGQPTSDGDGVKLTRVLTQPLQTRLDPFLMLDAFGSDAASDYLGGFPDHPHRGFETVTIMLAGRMRHRDSVGNVGLLEPGSVQWMTAGRGLIHSEMPEQQEGRMAGFQLWVNLAARDKMCAPVYRDVPPADVPALQLASGVAVRVIAGSAFGVAGAVQRPTTEPLLLDLSVPAGVSVDVALPPGHNAFLYVYGGGALDVGDGGNGNGGGAAPTRVDSERMAILTNPINHPGVPSSAVVNAEVSVDGVRLAAPAGPGAPVRVLLVAGAPLREPIAQYGPFEMNTRAELQQALADFRSGALAT